MEPVDLLWFLTVVGLINCEGKGVVKRMVMAGSDVVLPCSLNNKNIELALFDWMKDDRQEVFLYNAGTHSNSGHPGQDEQFKGRVSHFPDELINGNASIIIRNTRPSDSGSYTCYFPHIQQQRFHIELLVGVSPKPRVMILSITPDWALLQCEVRRAFPKTQIVWHDSDGIILPAEEKLEDSDDPHCPPALTLQTNVTKTSNFCCVVTQQEPHHMTEGHIHVHICRDSMKTKCVGVIAGAGVCDLVVFSTVLATFLICWKIGWFRYIRRTMRGKLKYNVVVKYP
ncbi:CD276 antigen-like isoform X2 [Stegastes partitus]|uniref:CD276 antigen-like isoform X2 n=1 Tax=Stegastes partitus TaxID=144197 RepID=A0A9Y4NWD4_9TELE|nr:PREDICTED: CD276 antigen-like isoform X2 [Stegastes partitus]